MRVCHICDTSVAGDYFRNIAAGLTESGIHVTLAELGEGEPPAWLNEIPGAEYFALGSSGKHKIPLAAYRLGREMRVRQIDVLQTHLFYSGIVGVLAKRFAPRTAVAMMRHHTGVVRMLGSKLHIAADRWMAEKADRVMTVSEAARKYMKEIDGIRRDDIEVVYLGFDFEKYRPDAQLRAEARARYGFADEDLVFGYVANIVPGKGHEQLLDAFAKIAADLPNAKLLFAGRGSLDRVDAAAAKLPAGKVVFAGWQADAPMVYNAMDIFVQPSLSEAFSQVLIEAMGCGLPVIATDVGGAREVIEDGVNGIIVQPGDTEGLAAAMLRAATERDDVSAIADRGNASVRQRFDVRTMVARHVELYRSWTEK